MNLDKLKESARKYEQSGQWRPAIEVYKKALREFEESGEGVLDPSLYNRIGDLEMKDGESSAAIRAYEQASDLYTEQGFFNNAIALCGKILRINASRTSTYLRLAQLNARKNFVGESRRNLVEYVSRMESLHRRDEALAALRAFADQFRSHGEIMAMLLEMLRTEAPGPEARSALERLAEDLERWVDGSGGRTGPASGSAVEGGAVTPTTSVAGDLVFLDLSTAPPTRSGLLEAELDPLDFDTPAAAPDGEWSLEAEPADGVELAPSLDQEAAAELEPLDLDSEDSAAEARAIDIDAYPAVESEAEAAVAPGSGPSNELVFIPVEPGAPERARAEPDPAGSARARAKLLAEVGDQQGAVEALDAALGLYEADGRFEEALEVAIELTRLEPDLVYRFQKRVELAYRSGRRDAMLAAYLELADALLRSGGREHAISVYRRVLEHDPENRVAAEAVARLTPPTPRESFVDLASLILDEPQIRDTRMRVGDQAPIEDEDQAFHEALAQFKRGIEENLDTEDFQAHYDLGIAFKEMGLLDEAIAQFQKALRAPEGRLKTSEQLGIAFFEKARFAIAEAVLRRAIESLPGGDEDKIGLIYWLGRAVEAQRRTAEALRCYERVLAVDIRFLDVGERMHQLSTEVG